jgi:L-ascorbate metabolism protein UlaG (beta-lactamase superfamily)
MSTAIRFLGVAGYEIVGPTARLLVDPFIRGNRAAPVALEELERPDLILASHVAADHMGDTGELSRMHGTPVVCGADARHKLIEEGVDPALIQFTVWGIEVEVAGIRVRPTESHHWSQGTMRDGTFFNGVPMGFLFEMEPGVRIWHWGDSALFGDLRLVGELHAPTVGLIGCATGPVDGLPGPGRYVTGEMSPREAALAAEWTGVKYAVASHYESADDPDVAEFLRLVEAQGSATGIALAPGETLVIDGDRHEVRA